MRKIFKYAFAALAAVVIVSCERPSGGGTPQGETPEFKPKGMTSFEVPAQGGEYSVEYVLTNPVQDGIVKASCPEDWVSIQPLSQDPEISFTVSENVSETPRETLIKVVYAYGENELSFNVNIIQQGKQVTDPEDFTLEIDAKTDYLDIILTITPSDNTIGYGYGLARKAELNQFSGSELDKVRAYCIAYFNLEINVGYKPEDLTVRGRLVTTYENRDPDTEYVIFAGAVNDNYELIGDPVYKFIKTPEEIFGGATIEVSCDKYFDGDLVAADYPEYASAAGKAAVPTAITVGNGAVGYRVQVLAFDALSVGVPQDKLLTELKFYGSDKPFVKIVDWGTTCTVLGAALDASGNYGDMFIDTITITRDGVTDISEFFPGSDNL